VFGGRFEKGCLGSSFVLNPSRESKLIGYVDDSGRFRSEASRLTHGAGCKLFLRLQCTSLTRADIVDLSARIHGSKGVSAHLGTVAEKHTENTASLSLDFEKKAECASCSNRVPFTVYSPV